MGKPNSKIECNKNENDPTEANYPSTPISTPRTRLEDIDPRSPSTDIVRTPIQINSNLNHNDTPIVGVINCSIYEDNTDNLNNSNLAVNIDPRSPAVDFTRTPIAVGNISSKLLSTNLDNSIVNLDPRSPTVEFTRTPIVVGNGTTKLRNKNLDNVRQQLKDCSPMKQTHTENNNDNDSTIETPVKVPGPILLGVSPFTKKLDNIQKRKSYVGLLETDLDYIETNLDNVSKTAEVEIPKAETSNKILSTTVEHSPSEINQHDDKNDSANILESKENETIDNPETNKPESSFKEQEYADTEISFKDNIAITSPIKETLEKICEIDQEIKEVIAIAHSPVRDFEDANPANDFDKKVTNLIYEDQQIVDVISKTMKVKDVNRTPLGERNMNRRQSHKTSNKLKVNDKPMNKQDYTVSKIPVFKEKKGKSRVMKQCENTPPRQRMTNDNKTRKSQWDADNTLII